MPDELDRQIQETVANGRGVHAGAPVEGAGARSIGGGGGPPAAGSPAPPFHAAQRGEPPAERTRARRRRPGRIRRPAARISRAAARTGSRDHARLPWYSSRLPAPWHRRARAGPGDHPTDCLRRAPRVASSALSSAMRASVVCAASVADRAASSAPLAARAVCSASSRIVSSPCPQHAQSRPWTTVPAGRTPSTSPTGRLTV
jgi:hypothetical protein